MVLTLFGRHDHSWRCSDFLWRIAETGRYMKMAGNISRCSKTIPWWLEVFDSEHLCVQPWGRGFSLRRSLHVTSGGSRRKQSGDQHGATTCCRNTWKSRKLKILDETWTQTGSVNPHITNSSVFWTGSAAERAKTSEEVSICVAPSQDAAWQTHTRG